MDPSDTTQEAALEGQQSQGDASGLRTESEKAVYMQLKQLKNQLAALEEKMMGVSELGPGVAVLKVNVATACIVASCNTRM